MTDIPTAAGKDSSLAIPGQTNRDRWRERLGRVGVQSIRFPESMKPVQRPGISPGDRPRRWRRFGRTTALTVLRGLWERRSASRAIGAGALHEGMTPVISVGPAAA